MSPSLSTMNSTMNACNLRWLMVTVCIVIGCIGTLSEAYVYTKIAFEYEGRCKDDNGELRTVGESWTYKKRCELATCIRSNGKLYEEVTGCIKVSAQRGCRLTPRLASDFPSCCPELRCNTPAAGSRRETVHRPTEDDDVPPTGELVFSWN